MSSAEQTTARNKKKNRGRRAQTEDFSNSGEDGDSASSEGKASTKHNKYFKIFGMGLIFPYSVNQFQHFYKNKYFFFLVPPFCNLFKKTQHFLCLTFS